MSHLMENHRAHSVVDVFGIDYYPVHPTAWRLDATASDDVDVGRHVGAASALKALQLPRVATITQTTAATLIFILLLLDSQVYAIYRFHINGMILGMVFGDGA